MKVNLLPKHAIIKSISCIIGYSLWIIASSSHVVDLWIDVPVCFYNVPESFTLNAPETINIHVMAPRHVLRRSMDANMAAHIDAAQLHEGKNVMLLSAVHLFLPRTITLIEHVPHTLEIEASHSFHHDKLQIIATTAS